MSTSTDNAEWKLLLASLAMGILAATPYTWNLIFYSLYTWSITHTIENYLVIGLIVFNHAVSLMLCYLSLGKYINKILSMLAAVCLLCVLSYGTLTFFGKLPSYVLLVSFSLTSIVLSLWTPITFQIISILPTIYQQYYSLGFLINLILYYGLTAKRLYTLTVFWVPFVLAITIGIYGLNHIRSSSVFFVGLQKRKSIFVCMSSKYMIFPLSKAISMIGAEIFIFIWLLIGLLTVVVAFNCFTEAVSGLNKYLFIFTSGAIWCAACSKPSKIMTLIFVSTAAVVTALTFTFLTRDIHFQGIGALSTIILLFHALGCELEAMKKKLRKGINGPKILYTMIVFCDVCVTITLIILNKL
ncbi:BMRF2-like protein [Saguinine gammaherpesvirus 1]|uniref:BMRF2-like protein n=1 Tax=Saguinine gammaherpesvirus 1 TaxID=2169901 RepID=A0A9Q8VJA9_9GAMA|nr:BMRF2-like protein [Saguinine gammaherpesvirus 1]